MKTFFKHQGFNSAKVVERPKFFRRLNDFKAQEAILRLSQNILHDRIFWAFCAVWFLPIGIIGLYAFLNLNRLPNQIPLFYSQVWGESQLASKNQIFMPIFGVLILGLFNFSFAGLFHPQNKVFSYVLCGSSALLSILAAITIFNIVNLMR